MKTVLLTLALTFCAGAAVAQPIDNLANSGQPSEVTGSHPVFPAGLVAIRQGEGQLVHHIGAIKPNAVLASVPFVYRKPVRLTEPMYYYLLRVKVAIEVEAGVLGFVADPDSPRPGSVCLFTSQSFRSRTCYARQWLHDNNNTFFRKTYVTSPFPQKFEFQKDDALVDAPVFEDAEIPGDFALNLHFIKWSGDAAQVRWLYDKTIVYKMAIKPAEKNGPVRIILPDGALTISHDPANAKGAVVTFEPATP